jgi:hypothetical protein
MSGMTNGKHSQPATGSRRDHLWVLVIIAGFALFDVWEAWSEVGNKSGFAHGTGWTLTVIVEAFAGYCLFAWFDAPGPRSRRFAMWSAITALTLSMVGQGASVLAARTMPPLWLMVFVRILPVIVLALIAVLVHLRRLDREAGEKEHAALERAEADERTALRAEVERLQLELAAAVEPLEAERDAARREVEMLTVKMEAATRKLAAASGQKGPRKTGQKKPSAAMKEAAGSTPEAQVPDDVDTQAAALEILAGEPGISGSELGRRLGRTPRYGCMLKNSLAGSVPGPEAAGS